jgi:hypothetical protein
MAGAGIVRGMMGLWLGSGLRATSAEVELAASSSVGNRNRNDEMQDNKGMAR